MLYQSPAHLLKHFSFPNDTCIECAFNLDYLCFIFFFLEQEELENMKSEKKKVELQLEGIQEQLEKLKENQQEVLRQKEVSPKKKKNPTTVG